MLVAGKVGDGVAKSERGLTLRLDGRVTIGFDNRRSEEGVTYSHSSVRMILCLQRGCTPYAGTIKPKYMNPPTKIL